MRDRIEVSLLVGLIAAMSAAWVWGMVNLVVQGKPLLVILLTGVIAAVLTFIVESVTSRG